MNHQYVPTELLLANWRSGSTLSENLAASILRLDGFTEIEPQAPLGGPDGRKDIICNKGTVKYVGAVYFPIGQKSFSNVKKKFVADLDGALRHSAEGIVFFCNQRLTVVEREKLTKIANNAKMESEIYGVERIVTLLDSPMGYGVRMQYLKIPMNPDEQFAFFVHGGNLVEQAIEKNSDILVRLGSKIDKVVAGQIETNRTLRIIQGTSEYDAGPSPTKMEFKGVDRLFAEPSVGPLTSNISPELILSVHRMICSDLPSRMVGQFRNVSVWLGREKYTQSDSKLEMPEPKKLPRLLEDLCESWNQKFPNLKSKETTHDLQLQNIAEFHAKLLQIHPFEDGNGRVAIAILVQQSLDLFAQIDLSQFAKNTQYYSALERADNEDFEALKDILRRLVLPPE